MLPHQGAEDEAGDSNPQHRQPHGLEGTHEGADDPVVPAGREMLELRQIVPNASDLLRGIGLVAKTTPELLLEDVLVDCGADRDAQRAAETSSEICPG